MKVLYVWDADYPWDIRVDKICTTLAQRGWEVHLVCRNRARKQVYEEDGGLYIHRLPALKMNSELLNNLYGFPAFFSPIWLRCIKDVAVEYEVDVIIVRDLPLALTAVKVGRSVGKPVVFDMAECYPELIRLIWKYEPFRFLNIFVRNPFLADVIESKVLSKVDHTFVMIEESKERLVKRGVSNENITIVSNTPVNERFENAESTYPGVTDEHRGKMILLYVGLINFSRGLDTVLRGLRRYVELSNDVFLVVLGSGNASNQLKDMVSQLSLTRHVVFEGWVDNRAIPEYVASSSICLVPHHKCGHWDHTIPNKLFDYMAAGKPVLVSNVAPMERIVNRTHCGLVYRDPDPGDFAAQLARLRDGTFRDQLGGNGSRAVQAYYNWAQDSSRMIEALKGVTRR